MTRTDQERGRSAGIFRDLAPIAAAAGAAALTVALLVGPPTARLGSVSGETSEAALALDATGRPGSPRGDIRVQVRPRSATAVAPAATDLTNVFDPVTGPEPSAVGPPLPSLTLVVAVRPQPASPVLAVHPVAPSFIPASEPVGLVPRPVATAPHPVALNPLELTTAETRKKRPSKPLRPMKEQRTSAVDTSRPTPSQEANDKTSDNDEARMTRAEDRAAEELADQSPDQAADRAANPSDAKRVDKSRK